MGFCEIPHGNYAFQADGGQTRKSPRTAGFWSVWDVLQIVDGAQGQNRTADTRIFSPLLYRLSYLGII